MRTVYYRAEDTGRGSRAVLAIAGSIAVHEILAGILLYLALFRPPTLPPDKVVAERVTIVIRHRATPPPTPPPPTPPPPTPVPTPQVTPTPRVALTNRVYNAAKPKVAAPPTLHHGGAAAPHQHVIVAPRPRIVVPLTPAPRQVAVAAAASRQNGTASGQANGGAGTGGGPGSGNGGAGGTDSGSGGSGTKSGIDAPLSPCGAVYFDPQRTVTNADGSQYVRIRVRVQLNNGQELADTLRWYFYYKTAAANPFNRRDEERIPMQFPPHGESLDAGQEPAIALALKHTRPNGTTDLPDCPSQTGSRS